MCTLGIHEGHGHSRRLGRKEGTGKERKIRPPYRLHQPSQPSRKERLESLSNQFHHRSTRIPTHQPVPYQTRVARGKELKHARGHMKQNGSKNPLYVGYDPQVFLYRTTLQDRLDTPKPTHRNCQQEHGKI